MIASERAFYESRQQQHVDQLEALNQKVSQKKQELSSVKVNKKSLKDSYRLLNQELNVTRPLVSEGAVSQVELLRLERQVNDLKGELDRSIISIPQLESELRGSKEKCRGLCPGLCK